MSSHQYKFMIWEKNSFDLLISPPPPPPDYIIYGLFLNTLNDGFLLHFYNSVSMFV